MFLPTSASLNSETVLLQVYLHLHDEPYKTKKAIEDEKKASMTPEELKKFKIKQKKEKKKAEAEEKRRQEELAAKRK